MPYQSIERTVEQLFDCHFKPRFSADSLETPSPEVHLLIGDTLYDLSETLSTVHGRLASSTGEAGLLPEHLDPSEVALGLASNWLSRVVDGLQPDAVAVFRRTADRQQVSYTLQCRGNGVTTRSTETASTDAAGQTDFGHRSHESLDHGEVDCDFRDLYSVDSPHRPFQHRIDLLDQHARSVTAQIRHQLESDRYADIQAAG